MYVYMVKISVSKCFCIKYLAETEMARFSNRFSSPSSYDVTANVRRLTTCTWRMFASVIGSNVRSAWSSLRFSWPAVASE